MNRLHTSVILICIATGTLFVGIGSALSGDRQKAGPIQNLSYDSRGYNKHGFNKQGYNERGYNRHGYYIHSYNAHGFNRRGYNKKGEYNHFYDMYR